MVKLIDDKSMNRVVSRHVANHPTLYAVAGVLEANVQALAAVHNKTGNYAGKVLVKPGRVDVHVQATDKAAAHIEFGHKLSGNPSAGKIPGMVGDAVPKTTLRRGGKWVNGLHIMRNATIMSGGEVDRGV